MIDSPRLALHAVLPLAVADYMRDFDLERSKSEFRDLLRAARETAMSGLLTREEAYEMAGRFIVDHSDLVIAVWDGATSGGRGGTAEIVGAMPAAIRCRSSWCRPAAAAVGPPLPRLRDRGRRRPAGSRPVMMRTRGRSSSTCGSTTASRLAAKIHEERERLAEAAHSSSLESSLDAVVAWDCHASLAPTRSPTMRYQRWHYGLGMTLYLSAALAVTAVAAQKLANWNRELALIETGFMVILFTVYVLARRLNFHDRWLGYRSLAEAFPLGVVHRHGEACRRACRP